MTNLEASIATAAARAGHGGKLSLLGLIGWALEWKHGTPALVEPFAGCETFLQVVVRLGALDDTVFVGLFAWTAILAFSTVSLAIGTTRLVKHHLPSFRTPAGHLPPPNHDEETKT